MKTYQIAGLKVNMSPFGRTESQAEKYRIENSGSADITIDIAPQVIEKAKQLLETTDESDAYYLASGFAFYRKLIDFNGFMLHSSAVCTGGGAYLFSGQSGIGKSTHTALWKELLGDKCFTLNDDKPALRLSEDGRFYAYGTPWSGKYDKSENVAMPVKGICFIGRSGNNTIERLDEKLAAIYIMNQCTKNFTEPQWEKVLSLIDVLVRNVPTYKLMCNKDISAAKLSYSTLTGEKYED